MVVAIPVADLRGEPHTTVQPEIHDPLQESQLLYGERVRVVKTENGWAHVEALEQPEYTHGKKWRGYPGWVPREALAHAEAAWEPNIIVTAKWAPTWTDAYQTDPAGMALPLGTMLRATDMGGHLWKVELLTGEVVYMRYGDAQPLDGLRVLPSGARRALVLRSADAFIGDPYVWGGRSPAREGRVTGVDCSGLVNLAYRAAGMSVPRDAHEQFLRARRVDVPQPADLIFLSERGDPERIVHVMLYAGEGELIEGPGTGQAVRRIAVAERLGRPLDQLRPGAVVNEQTVFFGSYLQ